jgi:hypothetical protein
MTASIRGAIDQGRRRRAHGIMPRKLGSKPWLAAGCSRSTWYKRQAREFDALVDVLDQLEHLPPLPELSWWLN